MRRRDLGEGRARDRRLVLNDYDDVLDNARDELYRQVEKWGEQNHPDGTGLDGSKYFADWARSLADENHDNGTLTWADILTEDCSEALAEKESSWLREELMQVAAVALQWADASDRRE